MAHKEVYPTRTGRYGTRMLTAGEPVLVSGPTARAMIALGRAADEAPQRVKVAKQPEPEPVDDLAVLRAEYQAKLGKRPFNGWNADTLREKIAAA